MVNGEKGRTFAEKAYFSSRLMGALSQMMLEPLTAICAPSGAGKTTAVRAFFSRPNKKQPRLLWYTSFGETPDAGWERACDLVAEIDQKVGADMKGLGLPTRQNLSLLAEVVQHFRCDKETVLVIDNAQLFGCEAPHELLCALAMHQSRCFHIVIITQNLLDEPARLLSTPGVSYIGAETFFFNAEESRDYFKKNGAALTGREVRQVMDNTRGWAAALRLQLLGYRQTGTIQKEAGIEQLIHRVIWNPLAPRERHFLIAFSQIGHATSGQICVLIGCKEMPAYGRKLLEKDDFIYYDAEENSYTMHQLLRGYAQSCLEELPTSERQVLHARTGQVYAEAGARFLAVRSFLRSGKYEDMLAVPLTNADMAEYGTDDVMALLTDIFAECPPALLEQKPARLLRFAFELLMRGEKAMYKKVCSIINKALRKQGLEGLGMRREFRGEYIFLRSFDAFNNMQKMNAAQKVALRLLGGASKAYDARRFWTFGTPSILASYWGEGTSLEAQADYLEQCIPDYIALTNGHGTGAVELMRAEAHLHGGRLDKAEILSNKAIFLAETQYQDTVYFGAQLVLGRTAILRGEVQGYLSALEHVHGRALAGTEKARHLVAGQCTAQLGVILGRLEEMPDWLLHEVEIRNHTYESGICYAMRLYTKQLLLKQDYNKVLGFAELMLETARKQNSMLLRIYYHLYLACALRATGAHFDAEEHLRAALALALPDQIYLPFAEELDALEELLDGMAFPDREMQQIVKIRQMGKKQRVGVARINKKILSAHSGLTKRENEVMELVKNGLTNREIGTKLGISPETVKTTLRNVFLKIGVHSRNELREMVGNLPRNG